MKGPQTEARDALMARLADAGLSYAQIAGLRVRDSVPGRRGTWDFVRLADRTHRELTPELSIELRRWVLTEHLERNDCALLFTAYGRHPLTPAGVESAVRRHRQRQENAA